MNVRVTVMALVCCGPQVTGYDVSDPTKLTCPCDDPDTCYESAAQLDQRGENAETGEKLLELSQCACLEGSYAGCNTLAHFAKDWVAACDADREPAKSCAIAGFIHEHAVRLPGSSGRSFHRDPAAAKAAFEKACRAGSATACRRARP
ncbi:MAG TPA: hypothetical protein VGH28_21845 [Polyangiaceae bacterium]|jgi:hypothetical protein